MKLWYDEHGNGHVQCGKCRGLYPEGLEAHFHTCAAPAAEPVAQRPEAPTLADDDAEWLRAQAGTDSDVLSSPSEIRLRGIAARIESDAARIRELEADNAGIVAHCEELIDRATKAEALLAASRERALACALTTARADALEEAARWHEHRGTISATGTGGLARHQWYAAQIRALAAPDSAAEQAAPPSTRGA